MRQSCSPVRRVRENVRGMMSQKIPLGRSFLVGILPGMTAIYGNQVKSIFESRSVRKLQMIRRVVVEQVLCAGITVQDLAKASQVFRVMKVAQHDEQELFA